MFGEELDLIKLTMCVWRRAGPYKAHDVFWRRAGPYKLTMCFGEELDLIKLMMCFGEELDLIKLKTQAESGRRIFRKTETAA